MWIVADINMKTLGSFEAEQEAEEFANNCVCEEVSIVFVKEE